MEKISLMPGDMIVRNSIEVAFSKLVLIFFYYALQRRFWKKDYRQSRTQVILYLVMFFCANLCCIVFANLYLFYSLKVEDDKNIMEFQIAMMSASISAP